MNILKGRSYYAKHGPTGEEWHLIGVSQSRNAVCCAGWPPTMANLSDCTDLELAGVLTEQELTYRTNQFGTDWDN
jgi:hypothetical protein